MELNKTLPPTVIHMSSGAAAGTLATLATHPFDVLKVSPPSHPHRPRNLKHVHDLDEDPSTHGISLRDDPVRRTRCMASTWYRRFLRWRIYASYSESLQLCYRLGSLRGHFTCHDKLTKHPTPTPHEHPNILNID